MNSSNPRWMSASMNFPETRAKRPRAREATMADLFRRLAGVSGVAAIAAFGVPSPVADHCASAQSLPRLEIPGAPGAASTRVSASSGDAASQRKEQRRQADLVKAIVAEITDFVPDHRAFIADNDAAQTQAMQALEDFRAKLDEALTADLIAMANDSGNGYATRVATTASRHAQYLSRAIASTDLDRFRNSDGRDDLAMAQYFLMAYRVEQLAQLARLYPDNSDVLAARSAAGDAMAQLGSLESVRQGRAEALAARIAAMRLRPAVRRDAAAERDFASAFRSSAWTQGEFAGSEVLRVNLLSHGWTVRRNPVTGIILSRDQQAALAVKRKDGKCFSYVIGLEQKSQGSTFGGTYMASGREREMLCENIGR
ncbi:hypothetical protein [Erythrobacter sp. JK5]|uniref:hypothetical protein n=1 Tax=Erythrobacter sp. JK5 TaxID=2829500 RepID=UPI001BA68063|nr:hypothetical protein [Erythrobacter sp. JK5]QUL36760.1 hypothetical protein KDC96_10060 [Erythrobacter sp. JK5]